MRWMLFLFFIQQGSIQGRDEFTENLSWGVHSLMGNTVGKIYFPCFGAYL